MHSQAIQPHELSLDERERGRQLPSTAVAIIYSAAHGLVSDKGTAVTRVREPDALELQVIFNDPVVRYAVEHLGAQVAAVMSCLVLWWYG